MDKTFEVLISDPMQLLNRVYVVSLRMHLHNNVTLTGT